MRQLILQDRYVTYREIETTLGMGPAYIQYSMNRQVVIMTLKVVCLQSGLLPSLVHHPYVTKHKVEGPTLKSFKNELN